MGNFFGNSNTTNEYSSSDEELELEPEFSCYLGKLELDLELYKKSIKEFTIKSEKFIEFQKEIEIISNQLKLDDNTNPLDESRKKFKSLTKIFIMYIGTTTDLIKASTMSDEIISSFYHSDTVTYLIVYFNTIFNTINKYLSVQEELKNEIEGYAIPKDD